MHSSRFLLSLTIPLLLLTGCAGTASNSCPPVVEYTPAQQDEAAAELALPLPMLNIMVGDYMVMRDQSRACRQ